MPNEMISDSQVEPPSDRKNDRALREALGEATFFARMLKPQVRILLHDLKDGTPAEWIAAAEVVIRSATRVVEHGNRVKNLGARE